MPFCLISEIIHSRYNQLRQEELNIILLRVNNFDSKQKKALNICFIMCHQHQTRSVNIKANKTRQISVKTSFSFWVFLRGAGGGTELQHI